MKKVYVQTIKRIIDYYFFETDGFIKQILEDELNSWKGDLEQVDDICIIGMRI